MIGLSELLARIGKIGQDETKIREIAQKAIKLKIGIELPLSDIIYKNSKLRVLARPVILSEIHMNKLVILQEIENERRNIGLKHRVTDLY